MAHHQPALVFTVIGMLLVLTGCLQEEPATPSVTASNVQLEMSRWQQDKSERAVAAASQLAETCIRFSAQPNDETRQELQSAWIAAHERWLEAALLLQIDAGQQATIDAWPMLPGFIDALPGYPDSGIVNDMTLPMTSEMLRAQHQFTDLQELSLGFHVIEYYAFERELIDFRQTSARRHQLLKLAADLLLLDIIAATRDTDPPANAELLISRLQAQARMILIDLNRQYPHGPYSNRANEQVRVQLTAIRDILNPPVGLNYLLLTMSAQHTASLQRALDTAISLTGDDQAIANGALLPVLAELADLLAYFAGSAAER